MKNHFLTRVLPGLIFLLLTGMIPGAHARNTPSGESMQAAYMHLKPELENSPYQNPVQVESVQHENQTSGDVYGIFNQPFSTIRKNLQDPASWCEVLFLHLNIKYCRAIGNHTVEIYAGTKKPQSLDDASQMQYQFQLVSDRADHMKIVLTAADGPYGTSNHRITMEAIPLHDGQSFIRIHYSYQYGAVTSMALKIYLATTGGDKAGMSITGKKSDGSPEYTSGMRGIIERNTLRYYLAVNAYLDSLSVQKDRQLEKRLSSWFDATEHYPQLHEISKKEYMAMKRDEYQRILKGQEEMNLAQ